MFRPCNLYNQYGIGFKENTHIIHRIFSALSFSHLANLKYIGMEINIHDAVNSLCFKFFIKNTKYNQCCYCESNQTNKSFQYMYFKTRAISVNKRVYLSVPAEWEVFGVVWDVIIVVIRV